jgi:hypothetical protein
MTCFTPRLGLNNSRIFELDGFELHIPPGMQLKHGTAQALVKGGVGSAASSSSGSSDSKRTKVLFVLSFLASFLSCVLPFLRPSFLASSLQSIPALCGPFIDSFIH